MALTLDARAVRDRFTAHWAVLSGGFLILSFDEGAQIHEYTGFFLRGWHLPGIFHYAWVIPALVLVAMLATAYLRFLFSLPTRYRIQFVLAGALFVGGAVGMEMVGGAVLDVVMTKDHIGYMLCFHLEELLEMMGIALFIAALVELLEERLGSRGLRVLFQRS